MNINTKEYWENRFRTGDWEKSRGRKSTRCFALAQIEHLKIPSDFAGTLLDFGCGLGDAFPVYRKAFPMANLIGMDFSESAIEQCVDKYGDIAKFLPGNHKSAPSVDVVISSNVFEHLTDPIIIAKDLFNKCKDLYIVVPYKQNITPGSEHINTFDEKSFDEVGNAEYAIFAAETWTQTSWDLWINVYLKNLIRPLMGRKTISPNMQIMLHFSKPGITL